MRWDSAGRTALGQSAQLQCCLKKLWDRASSAGTAQNWSVKRWDSGSKQFKGKSSGTELQALGQRRRQNWSVKRWDSEFDSDFFVGAGRGGLADKRLVAITVYLNGACILHRSTLAWSPYLLIECQHREKLRQSCRGAVSSCSA